MKHETQARKTHTNQRIALFHLYISKSETRNENRRDDIKMKSVNIENKHVNLDAVKNYYFSGGKVCIEYMDGSKDELVYKDSVSVRDDMTGARHIVQALPSPIPLWVVGEDESGGHTAERILFFGLSADGSLYPLGSSWGYFDIEDCYVGLFTEAGLKQFENLTYIGLIDPSESNE